MLVNYILLICMNRIKRPPFNRSIQNCIMNVPEQLSCLFSAEVETKDDSHVIEIPKNEIETGYVNPDDTHQLAVLALSTESSDTVDHSQETSQKTSQETGQETSQKTRSQNSQQPPVAEGETRIVEIEDIGDQGDGLTRVENGYVIIVADTEKGERVRIEIDTVRQNVAFANVVERISYYD